eukprot:CAMPEP_0114249638 /NCGR_PEP_ID=MMETSP0058-20121206/14257_1 /TAXON_ID=36894 /ORGANISM="Pyramimonas parkeae, CCMP726" /LENGTH=73 /DNA_ID=CAMNT_0001363213 /DNA_START=586 /DNA_END=804 /DNA_ORIENTATION=+
MGLTNVPGLRPAEEFGSAEGICPGVEEFKSPETSVVDSRPRFCISTAYEQTRARCLWLAQRDPASPQPRGHFT